MKSKKTVIKKAIVAMHTASMNSAQKVKYARDVQTAAQASPAYQGSTMAQASMSTWQSAANALDQNQIEIAKTTKYLETLRGQEVHLVFEFETAASQYGAVAQAMAKGDSSIVSALGLTLRTPSTPAVEIAAPLGLKIKTSKKGVDSLAWDKVQGARLYVAQISSDPAAADASFVPLPGNGRQRKLTGLIHGQRYLVRIKALGAKLESAWSAVLGFTAK